MTQDRNLVKGTENGEIIRPFSVSDGLDGVEKIIKLLDRMMIKSLRQFAPNRKKTEENNQYAI